MFTGKRVENEIFEYGNWDRMQTREDLSCLYDTVWIINQTIFFLHIGEYIVEINV